MSNSHLHKPVRQVDGISLYYSGDIAVIVFDRGENRLNPEFVKAFITLLDDVESNAQCKGLITTNKGKFYGNGLDLELLGKLSQEDLATFFTTLMEMWKRLLLFPVPTLAAINGHSFAGGALVAFMHDLRTMKIGRGWICLNEVFISRRFSHFLLKTLRTKIGTGKNFTDATVLGKRYTAEESFSCGMVHSISSESVLIPESVRTLKAFSGKTGYPRESLVDMKEDVYKDALEEFSTEVKSKL